MIYIEVWNWIPESADYTVYFIVSAIDEFLESLLLCLFCSQFFYLSGIPLVPYS